MSKVRDRKAEKLHFNDLLYNHALMRMHHDEAQIPLTLCIERYLELLDRERNSSNPNRRLEAIALYDLYNKYLIWYKVFSAAQIVSQKELPQINEIRQIKGEIQAAIAKEFPKLHVEVGARLKSLSHLQEKFFRSNQMEGDKTPNIKDMLGIALKISNTSLEDNINYCYFLGDLIADMFQQLDAGEIKQTTNFDYSRFVGKIYRPDEIPIVHSLKLAKDYIRYPKDNGYQKYHILVKISEFVFEVQIGTQSMFLFAENADACHFKYKEIVTGKNDSKIDYTKYNHIAGFYSILGIGYNDSVGLVKALTI